MGGGVAFAPDVPGASSGRLSRPHKWQQEIMRSKSKAVFLTDFGDLKILKILE